MNKYEIIKDVGVGTFGTVYEAINKITNEKVAIKKLRQKIDSWEKCMNQNEVYFLRKLNHPNIIKLLEVIREKNNDISLIFEYCDFNLYEIIKNHKRNQTPIPESKIKNIVYNITLGLSYLHSNGIMHRDLKPENILIKGNEIKIADFGTAKELPKYNTYNDMNIMTDYICTRWYRAPECVLKSKNYNEKVDIWALGCIMAELYILRPIFPGQSEFDQIEKIFKILGTPKKEDWEEGFELMIKLGIIFPQYNRINLKNLFLDISDDALNFLELIFQYDEIKRTSADELLNHPYLTNYMNNNSINNFDGFNKINIYKKLNRDFSKNLISWKKDYFNYFNSKNNNNLRNFKEKPKTNSIILPEITRNNIDNFYESRFNLAYHRNNSYLINSNSDYFTDKNKNTNLRSYFLSNKFKNRIKEGQDNISNSFVFSNYLKNNKSILQSDEHTKEQNSNNQYSTMAKNKFINRKNFLFDKYENKSKDNIFNFSENFHYAFPKMKRFQSNYHIKDKFKNFGYNYFPDGNYRSIFSLK